MCRHATPCKKDKIEIESRTPRAKCLEKQQSYSTADEYRGSPVVRVRKAGVKDP